jgi:hypothetical protein
MSATDAEKRRSVLAKRRKVVEMPLVERAAQEREDEDCHIGGKRRVIHLGREPGHRRVAGGPGGEG